MTLVSRRIRADLIEVFRILTGMAAAVEGMGLVRDRGGRKGHDHKLYINSVRLDVGIHSLCLVLESVSSGMIYHDRLWVWEV